MKTSEYQQWIRKKTTHGTKTLIAPSEERHRQNAPVGRIQGKRTAPRPNTRRRTTATWPRWLESLRRGGARNAEIDKKQRSYQRAGTRRSAHEAYFTVHGDPVAHVFLRAVLPFLATLCWASPGRPPAGLRQLEMAV